MRGWVQRHNLLAARDGGSLPDLGIARDGDEIMIRWVPDSEPGDPRPLRFIGRGRTRLGVGELERSMTAFVEAVLARLEERLPGNEAVTRLADTWDAIRSATPAEMELCRSLAAMGVDPYDEEEADDQLVEAAKEAIRSLPEGLRSDFFEGCAPTALRVNLRWVEQARGTIVLETDNGSPFPMIGPLATAPAHETGYLAARQVRAVLLGLNAVDPIADIASTLEDHLGWTRGCSRSVPAEVSFDGMVGRDRATSAPVLVVADSRSVGAERFRLARAAYFAVTGGFGASGRLLTRAVTFPQRASRAFAAELLAPAAALADRVSGRLYDQDLEELSLEFQVSTHVIRHQIENHGLGYVEV